MQTKVSGTISLLSGCSGALKKYKGEERQSCKSGAWSSGVDGWQNCLITGHFIYLKYQCSFLRACWWLDLSHEKDEQDVCTTKQWQNIIFWNLKEAKCYVRRFQCLIRQNESHSARAHPFLPIVICAPFTLCYNEFKFLVMLTRQGQITLQLQLAFQSRPVSGIHKQALFSRYYFNITIINPLVSSSSFYEDQEETLMLLK